ncbi:hypothetical protein DSO57_1031627 [Entomophthora muscae]|uniref:Uncharacterized protein n=2 Tax=Entomophthora muscae TaxID=34485 RepID=A0ACC2UBF7_9FUNG|nr:hypothetical protein DSO57_1008499 [Entomophthora muscae]KAJ9083747.1 hypothetical protein DSO57_1031627 [Entomophthora muscae]
MKPVGTGFSYGDGVVNSTEAAALDVYFALNAFYGKFPRYRRRRLHIVSESFGGHFAPGIASVILDANKVTNSSIIRLESIAVGNGLISPSIQFKSLAQIACHNKYAALFSLENCHRFEKKLAQLITHTLECLNNGTSARCCKAWSYFITDIILPHLHDGHDIYDIRSSILPTHRYAAATNATATAMNDPFIRSKLLATNITFITDHPDVNTRFIKSGDM